MNDPTRHMPGDPGSAPGTGQQIPPAPAAGERHPGPPLAVLATIHAVLFVGSLMLVAAWTGGGHLPSPFGTGEAGIDFVSRHALAVRWSALLQFGAAIPLGLFAATAASRLRFLGIRAAGATIALFGGIAAAICIALSALVQWSLTWVTALELLAGGRALYLLAFAIGGPGAVVCFGLLLAGVAVTSGLSRLLPRWLMWAGLLLASAAELSTLSLVWPVMSLLLPIARFGGMAWLIAAGALLPVTSRRPAAAS
jgi:hypothetical protein